jgi:hypothetical protein
LGTKEITDQFDTAVLAFLRMELRGDNIVPRNDRSDGLSVLRASHHVVLVAAAHREAVDKIKGKVGWTDSGKHRMFALLGHGIPTHMGNFQRRIARMQADNLGINPTQATMRLALIGMFFGGASEKLHPETDGKEWLALLAHRALQQSVDSARLQLLHRVAECTNAGQDHM